MTAHIICDEKLTGTYNQCLAVQKAMGDTYTPILISAGRRSFWKAALHKFKNPNTFWVWLQKPPFPWPRPDLVAAPMHDQITGKNAIQTIGAPNRITPQTLDDAKNAIPQFATLPTPRIAVLIGGNSKTHTITPDIIRNIATKLNTLDGSVMVTASRRTGKDNIQLLTSLLKDNIYIWNGEGENPYHAMLAYADHIIVTNDSVSMISDAATTGKPVHIISLLGASKKFNRFYAELNRLKVTKPFDGTLRIWSYNALNDALYVAQEIRKRIDL